LLLNGVYREISCMAKNPAVIVSSEALLLRRVGDYSMLGAASLLMEFVIAVDLLPELLLWPVYS